MTAVPRRGSCRRHAPIARGQRKAPPLARSALNAALTRNNLRQTRCDMQLIVTTLLHDDKYSHRLARRREIRTCC